MFRTIVVSVDGSEPSSHALATAVDIAKRYGAHLTIVHAVMDDAPLSSLIEVAESHGFMDQITAELDEASMVRRLSFVQAPSPSLMSVTGRRNITSRPRTVCASVSAIR